LFLALQAFSASRSLHQVIHKDAGSPGHQCALTLFAQGQVNAPVAGLQLAAVATALLFCVPSAHAVFFSSTDLRLSPSRAPPAATSSVVVAGSRRV
jgi:hypothetical protein